MTDPTELTGAEQPRDGAFTDRDGVGEPSGAEMGVLNVNKPAGLTSHQVVAKIRRLADVRRVGHAGTLDPTATGVLVVCLGPATRVAEYIANATKSYLATIHFGVVTNTWDTEGRVVERHSIASLSLGAIQEVLPSFQGRITQVPPAFSALKQDGQPLYRLARRGIEVRPAPRMVEIQQLGVIEWRPPALVLKVTCTKGTYIRSLAHDLGQRLGVGAHLSALVRLAVGPFKVEDAVALETLEHDIAHLWSDYVMPMRVALAHLPGVTVDDDTARRVSLGQAVQLSEQAGGVLFAFTKEDRLLAVLEYDEQDTLWHPHKVLLPG